MWAKPEGEGQEEGSAPLLCPLPLGAFFLLRAAWSALNGAGLVVLGF